MTTPTRRPTSRADIAGIAVPLGEFAVDSVIGENVARAVLLTASDCDTLDTAQRWMREVADEGDRVRTEIHLNGLVRLDVDHDKPTSLNRAFWTLSLKEGTGIGDDALASAADTISAFAGEGRGVPGRIDTGVLAFAAFVRALSGDSALDFRKVEEAYGDTLANLGLIDTGPKFSATFTVTFDRSSQPGARETSEWLEHALRNAPERPCGSPADWLGEVSVDEITTTT